jgi:hypothetical protein
MVAKLGLTLGGQHILRVFKYRVLRRIFRLERDEVIEVQRYLHKQELHNSYCSSSKIGMFKQFGVPNMASNIATQNAIL